VVVEAALSVQVEPLALVAQALVAMVELLLLGLMPALQIEALVVAVEVLAIRLH
jgi:hypothetical protein